MFIEVSSDRNFSMIPSVVVNGVWVLLDVLILILREVRDVATIGRLARVSRAFRRLIDEEIWPHRARLDLGYPVYAFRAPNALPLSQRYRFLSTLGVVDTSTFVVDTACPHEADLLLAHPKVSARACNAHAFYVASALGRVNILDRLLPHYDPETDSHRLLGIAACLDHVDVIRWAIEKGIVAVPRDVRLVLTRAVERGFSNIVRLFSGSPALDDPIFLRSLAYHAPRDYRTALWFLAEARRISEDFWIETTNEFFARAANYGNVPLIRHLLATCASEPRLNPAHRGNRALLNATHFPEMLVLLLDHPDPRIDSTPVDGCLFREAARSHASESVRILLERSRQNFGSARSPNPTARHNRAVRKLLERIRLSNCSPIRDCSGSGGNPVLMEMLELFESDPRVVTLGRRPGYCYRGWNLGHRNPAWRLVKHNKC